jgi:uncharacterized membrane protein YfcA
VEDRLVSAAARRFILVSASGKMPAMEPWLFLFVIAVVFVAATAQTVTGFGFALVAVPFFIIFLEPKEVVVLTALVALANAAIVTRRAWEHVPWRTVATMIAGAVLGLPVGLFVLLFAPDEALRIGVAVASIVMAFALAAGVTLGRTGARGEVSAGAISGVLTTSTGMNGPPVVLYLAGRRLHPTAFRGALSSYFLVGNILSLTTFAIAGVLSWPPVLLAIAALPALIPATMLGHAMVGRLRQEVFRTLVLAMLVITSLAAIITTLART